MDYTLVTYSSKKKYFDLFIPDNGIAYLAASIKQAGGNYKYFDLNSFSTNEENFLSHIEKEKPEIVGFKIFQSGFRHTKELAKEVRKVSPRSLVIAGGPQTTMYREAIFNNTDVFNMLVVGESEKAITELGEYVAGARKIEDVRNIIYKRNGRIIKNSLALEKNLDTLVFPDYGGFDLERNYFPIFLLNMVRGCPNQCSFCAHNYMWGRGIEDTELQGAGIDSVRRSNLVRKRSFSKVKEEIERYNSEYGVHSFSIPDSTPSLDLILEFCDYTKVNNKNTRWVSFGKIDLLNENHYKIFAESGCSCLWYGIESGNQEILNKIGKKYTNDDIKNAIFNAKKYGIKTVGGFILGFPGETEKSLSDTRDLVNELNLDSGVISAFYLQPGSPIAYNPSQYGIRPYNDWVEKSMDIGEEDEPHEVPYYEINGVSNTEWWKRFKDKSKYRGWDSEQREMAEYEYACLISDILGITPKKFIEVIGGILGKNDKKAFDKFLAECWRRNERR